MAFGEAIRSVFSQYATFSGRARRSEFWWFYLFMVIVNSILGSLVGVAQLTAGSSTQVVDGVTITSPVWSPFLTLTVIIASVWWLATLLPTLAVQVRRLHDSDRTGWWWWLIILCCVGPIILIVFWVMEGTRGPNRYGADPRTA